MAFITKDSWKRKEFSTGMQRDTGEWKARFDLLMPLWVPYEEQYLTRIAELMARGAEKYDPRNREQACTQEELERFKDSAFRHFVQWMAWDLSEDHASAIYFNVMGAETAKYKIGVIEKKRLENKK